MAAGNVEQLHAINATASFVCQRCTQPLKLHSSFSPLEEQFASELSIPENNASCWMDVSDRDSDSASRRSIPPGRHGDNGQEFTMVGVETREISNNLRWCAGLFDMLTDESTVDHPLCEECTDSLLDLMDSQLKAAEDDRHEYKEFLRQHADEFRGADLDAMDQELNQLMEQEQQLIRELEAGEKMNQELAEQMEKKNEELQKLKEKDSLMWVKRNEQDGLLTKAGENLRSMENQVTFIRNHNDRLEKSNVFNATFHIWHNGNFGTINGFRLGRLDHSPVEWDEINAAWGQAVLLLHSLAKKMGLEFKRYRLVPQGSVSYIESLDTKKELPLYGVGGFKFFWDQKFDHAMVAYLDCLEQFKRTVEERDKNIRLPYKIEKGRIEDPQTQTVYSVRAQLNSLEGWTKALKFMLTNLKWGLAWVASNYPDGGEGLQ